MTTKSHKVNPADKVEQWPIDKLVPYARNSRTHSDAQVDQIAASIREWGWTTPVLVDEVGGIIAGHGRVMAAKKLGVALVPVVVAAGWSDAKKRAYVIADNKLALNAGWDNTMLALELGELGDLGFDVGLTGFSDEEIKDLMTLQLEDGQTDPDDVPDLPETPVSRMGDVWILGPHRVVCGDSTTVESWDKVMQGERADICWTDPPYNVAYESKLAGSIKNDNMDDGKFRAFLQDAFVALFTQLKPGGAVYVAHADTEGYNFRHAFREAGFKLSGCLVWKKDSLVLGRSDYQWMHEPILYGWKPGSAHRWYGGRKLTTVQEWAGEPVVKLADGKYQIVVGDRVLTVSGEASIEETPSSVVFCEKPKRSAEHPTMKPVGLIERQLKCNARSGDIVVDGFGGSGSTMMAAERLGMCARLVEFDPKFVDVIVKRYQDYSGRKAVHAESGKTFEELSNGS
jgi:DNA modification methylase